MVCTLVPGDRIRADPELSKCLGSVVVLLGSLVTQRVFLTAALQAQYVWFGDGCAGLQILAQNKPSSTQSSWLIIDSWLRASLKHLFAEVETHPNHREQDIDGDKNGLCWCDAREILREVDGFDGHI